MAHFALFGDTRMAGGAGAVARIEQVCDLGIGGRAAHLVYRAIPRRVMLHVVVVSTISASQMAVPVIFVLGFSSRHVEGTPFLPVVFSPERCNCADFHPFPRGRRRIDQSLGGACLMLMGFRAPKDG